MVSTRPSQGGRVWVYAVLPAVILNVGAVLLFGTYYALRAVSPRRVDSVTPSQIQFIAYLFVFLVELAFASLLSRQLAASSSSLRAVMSRDGRFWSFRWGPALALFVAFNGCMLAYVWIVSLLYGAWPSLRDLSIWQRVFLLLAVPLQAAFAEELIWRGYLIGRLQALGRSASSAVTLSAISFALIHGVFLPDKLILTFVLGLVTGFYYLREGRLVPLMITHFVADLWSFGLTVL